MYVKSQCFYLLTKTNKILLDRKILENLNVEC